MISNERRESEFDTAAYFAKTERRSAQMQEVARAIWIIVAGALLFVWPAWWMGVLATAIWLLVGRFIANLAVLAVVIVASLVVSICSRDGR